MLARSLVHGSGEARIAASTTATASDHHALIGCRKIENLLARFFVVNDRSHRNLQENVFTFASALVRPFAVPSALRLVFRIETEMNQRVVALAGLHDYIAAVAPVSARRPASRNIFLATEGHAAIAAVARLNPNFRLINEHDLHYSPSKTKSLVPRARLKPRRTARRGR